SPAPVHRSAAREPPDAGCPPRAPPRAPRARPRTRRPTIGLSLPATLPLRHRPLQQRAPRVELACGRRRALSPSTGFPGRLRGAGRRDRRGQMRHAGSEAQAREAAGASPETLLSATDLVKRFALGPRRLGRSRGWVQAVSGVSLEVAAGETLALV